MNWQIHLLFAVAALLAIAAHGAGHILVGRLAGIPMQRVRYTATGLRLISGEGGFPSYSCEAWIALGGPLGNLIGSAVVIFIHRYCHALPVFCDYFVTLSLYLGALNLLPIKGFDGGRILVCLLCAHHPPVPSLLPRQADRVLSVTSGLLLILFWLVAVYLLLRRGTALSLHVFCMQLFYAVFVEQSEAEQLSRRAAHFRE